MLITLFLKLNLSPTDSWPVSIEDVLAIQGHELGWLLDGLDLDQQVTHREQNYETVA